VGDKVIKSLSSLLVKHVRNSDIVSRFGGEEFALLLPFTDKNGAGVIAEKLRAAVEKQNININDSNIKYTISLGIDYIDIEKDKHISEALDRADAALYRAKEAGRNRVVAN
jgi:diguanylate cyclase (GGDEF)-like protein